ncbi:hypothetical protein NP233_g684 [Leucocoprinus birnbaumii]|uniref:Uncharacterized protein n=1 Tax=Leucocoprinus birnbaumii TaxID=56174 RepID=A0AAD5W1E1_9AGAR|nr:hypothetical protein NP233_g684 [Leucocoprinus birnbaumii]
MPKTWKISAPLLTAVGFLFATTTRTTYAQEPVGATNLGFFHQISQADELCVGGSGPAPSFAGWIGLDGDTGLIRYWHAEEDPDNAPIVLSMGGGPGSSGMMNALLYEAPCLLGVNGSTTPNENRWTAKFNLLALDHPIGVGYSYGTRVNNSRDAAEDVYDFLQKFFALYPGLSKNQLVLADGSYGGVYLAHIGSVINDHNKEALHANDATHTDAGGAEGKNIHVNLESIILHNPIFTANEYAEPIGVNANRSVEASNICLGQFSAGSTNGILLEDIRKRKPTNHEDTNSIQPHHLLYEPLLKDGIRILFTIGAQDANCAWPGVLSSVSNVLTLSSPIKLLEFPYQAEFLGAEDVAWPSRNITVRKTGPGGAGHLTYVLLQDAGHTVGQDQPAYTKEIAEKWVFNEPFF